MANTVLLSERNRLRPTQHVAGSDETSVNGSALDWEPKCWRLFGSGGVLSSVGDLLRWHQALEDPEFLDQSVRSALFTPHVVSEAGWHYG